MIKKMDFKNKGLYNKIKAISNPVRFKILELTQSKELTVTELGKIIHIKYTRCSEYIKKMEELNIVAKRKEGRKVYVKNVAKLSENSIGFP